MSDPETTGIVELTAVCGTMCDLNNALFATLGSWVATTESPAQQHLFAEASHRHAWHAELWAERRPAIPVDAAAVADMAAFTGGQNERLAWYRTLLDAVAADVAALGTRVDRTLDPATARVVDLVGADLDALRGRAEHAG